MTEWHVDYPFKKLFILYFVTASLGGNFDNGDMV